MLEQRSLVLEECPDAAEWVNLDQVSVWLANYPMLWSRLGPHRSSGGGPTIQPGLVWGISTPGAQAEWERLGRLARWHGDSPAKGGISDFTEVLLRAANFCVLPGSPYVQTCALSPRQRSFILL